jgi:hypothetical protein
MRHVEAKSATSQSEKFYSNINWSYILVGLNAQTHKVVGHRSSLKHGSAHICGENLFGTYVVTAAANSEE